MADPLFQPLQIGPLRLKNRIVLPPMGTGLDEHGVMNDAAIAHYKRRADGGAGTITVEALLVDPDTEGPEPRVWSDEYLPGLRRLRAALRPSRATVGAQLLHPGRQVMSGRHVAPSAIGLNSVALVPHELTPEEIEAIVGMYADAAARVEAAGFDFVEIHGAHGYLPSDFASPLHNQRTDAYGGDRERRSAFPRAIVRAIVARCPGLPVFYRLSADEALPGGITVDDAIALAQGLVADGVACISVSAGHWLALQVTLAPMFQPRALLLERAGAIRAVVDVPVMVVGRLDLPADARRAVADGYADLVAIGRGQIAEPDWARKVEAGREDDLRPCIACNACSDRVGQGGEVRCAVNPEVGRDDVWRTPPAEHPRRVSVVGGGPAGIEGARVARLRGHAVTLWERDSGIGGKIEAAASAPSKGEVLRFRDYGRRVLGELGVDVRTGAEVSPETLKAEADAVIVATGAAPLVPPTIAGSHMAHVHDAQLLLRGEVEVPAGARVIVIGGSATGCETAELLVAAGAVVTVLELSRIVGVGIEAITRRHILRALRSGGATVLSGAQVISINSEGVWYARGDERLCIPADLVALAVGWRARGADFAEALTPLEVHVVGDAAIPGDFVLAVNSGADAGLAV